MSTVKRVTLNDVAAASGVSRATVSFVLNDDPKQTISGATRDRVRQAARTLGYVPHGLARALREGTSRIVVLNLDRGLEGNYCRSYLQGLDEELAAHDYALFVRHPTEGGRSQQQVLDAIAPRAVLTFGEVYLAGHPLDDQGGGWDDGMAAHVALQVGHLADRSHTNIAMALPATDSPVVRVRLQFVREVLDRRSLPGPVTLTLPRTRQEGAPVVRDFMADHPEVTAVAAFDDDVALRMLAALHDLGVAVPDGLAVIGYDDTEYGGLVTPSLTTVHINAEVHGRRAARTALGLDAADLVAAPARVIVRESA
ncbi:DNA-binding LacI/PurR family transcriptional regulator [Streptomyces sp. 846.5]|nr:DNA-binding LacI/PurR family transcriptional regulator [Streptomyces sp. 846.5]